MIKSIIVVDNFLRDPDELREIALSSSLQYPHGKRSTGFTGRSAQARWPGKGQIKKRIEKLVGSSLKISSEQSGYFVALTKSDFLRKKSFVHFDFADWSAVLCLSPNIPVGIATRFFRHKLTGLLGMRDYDKAEKAMEELDLDLDGLVKRIGKDTANKIAWEEVSSVGYVYNRLILFSPWLFHSAAAGFGTNISNAKLNFNMWFHEKK